MEIRDGVNDYNNGEQIATYRRGRKCYVERQETERERALNL